MSSGSISSWIEENILSSTGFMGRLSLILTLEELLLSDCKKFWNNEKLISPYEKFKILAVTGGVPRYLEEIKPHLLINGKLSLEFFKRELSLLYQG